MPSGREEDSVVRIVHRGTGKLPDDTPPKPRKFRDPRRTVFEREAENLRMLLPAYRKRFAIALGELREELDEQLDGGDDDAFAHLSLGELLGAEDPMFITYLVGGDDPEEFRLCPPDTEIHVRSDGHGAPEVSLDRPASLFNALAGSAWPVPSVSPDLNLLLDPDHWISTWKRWHHDLVNPFPRQFDGKPVTWGVDNYLDNLLVDVRRDLCDLSTKEPTTLYMPVSLARMLLLQDGDRTPWPKNVLGPLSLTGGEDYHGGVDVFITHHVPAQDSSRDLPDVHWDDQDAFTDKDRLKRRHGRWCRGETEP